MRMNSALSSIAFVLGACSYSPVPLAEDAAWVPRTVLETEQATLHSPYGPEVSQRIASSVDFHAAGLRTIYGVEQDLDLTVRLVPVAVGDVARWQENLAAMKGHVRGYSLGREPGRVVIYVPDVERESRAVPPRLLRHELAHDFNKRVGLGGRPRWIAEGLAQCVEHWSTDTRSPQVGLALPPSALYTTGRWAQQGSAPRLLAWRDAVGEDLEAVAENYLLAYSFVLYLLREHTNGDFVERSRQIVAMTAQELIDLEPDWLRWATELDFVADLRSCLSSPDVLLRAEALDRAQGDALLATYMTTWSGFSPYAPEVLEVALAGLGDMELAASASWYLLSTDAARHLDPSQVREEVESPNVERAFIGQALLKSRGEEPDLSRARDLFARMTAEQRERCFWGRFVLGLEGGARG